MTECRMWFRNPEFYVRELAELAVTDVVWDMGYLVKKSLDPIKHADMYFTALPEYNVLVVGDSDQGATHYKKTFGPKPFATYPVWSAHEDFEVLEELMATREPDLPTIVVTDLPLMSTGLGRRLLRLMRDAEEEYPQAMLHVHGLYGFRPIFGPGWRSADYEPRELARKGKVVLPSGKEMTYEQTVKCPQWVTLLHETPKTLEVPRTRCMYNIKSALWAGRFYSTNIKFRQAPVQPEIAAARASEPESKFLPIEVGNVYAGKPGDGDKFVCNLCSLQNTCKYYREGSVCSVPDSEPASLARFFKTRDSDTIIEGLGTLLAASARRLESGMAEEESYGELDPEVTKILNSTFSNGVKLAKLVNPSLSGGPKVGVFVNGGAVGVGQGTNAGPKAMVAAMVAELEARGIPRDRITPAMIESMLNPEGVRPALEAQVVAHDS